MSKLSQITLSFWIMKICATTLGETAGDLLSMTLDIGYLMSSLVLLCFFFMTLSIQLLSKEFNPIKYWLVILATSTAGTTISDFMDRTLGLGYAKGSLILFFLLALTLIFWFLKEKSLAVTNVKSTRVEVFYWTAILFSNTLGTALGDFLADNSGLGFLGSALLIGSLLFFITMAYYFTKINSILLFWLAFILTRPFGATFGDLLTKSHEKGGLNFGTVGSSIILFVILMVLITISYFEIRAKKRSNQEKSAS
jgi:uncharacterized membrane-anchored protein